MTETEPVEKKGTIELNWIGSKPPAFARVVLLIPQYNESTNLCMQGRLNYFNSLAEAFSGTIDIVIIDDGSTDESLKQIKDYCKYNNHFFYTASVFPNANKVGALSIVTSALKHEFVVLSDFDTDLEGLHNLVHDLDMLSADRLIMGGYFKMKPFKGKGLIFSFQKLEYCMARCLYRFHKLDDTVPVMPGAGCFFKRNLLEQIYVTHSGLRNGEDREATIIGLKSGFKVCYLNRVIALTRTPPDFKKLCIQRIRWNLGYIETVFLQAKFKHTIQLTIRLKLYFDILITGFIMSFPLISVFLLIKNPFWLLLFYSVVYVLTVIWCIILLSASPDESKGVRRSLLVSIIFFPVIKIALDFIAWAGAFQRFFNKDYRDIKGMAGR